MYRVYITTETQDTRLQIQPLPLSEAAPDLLNNNIRTSTKALYKSKMKAFAKYCAISGADPKTCHPNVVVNFLAELVCKKGLSYQIVCGYRSAIFKQHIGFGSMQLGQLPEIKKLAQAVFIMKTALPRY